MKFHREIVSFFALVLSATTVLAQRDLKDIPDPDPEIERKSFQVAEGFEVNLYAADPRIAKPIQMNFDSRGRLWIAGSEVYPQIQPGQQANDRILVVEDTDNDSVADKTTVFAEGLLIPTGVEPGDGGAYAADSTELVHFKDTDGDGKADVRRVLLSGFGTEDTHHILHTFRWGMDGMLYFNQSIYIHSHIETPWGVRRLGGGGIWQYRPESQQLEILCRGFVNPWGHHQDDWGQSFATDGAYGEGINYVFPGSVFVTAPGANRIVKGLNPGSPKHCGLEILSGTHLPEEWRGNMITNDFRGHRVCRFVISEDGSGYASREMPELIKTSHVAFRPIDVKMGPDGAIYIADWYNPIIQHGEVDFRDPRRDHVHGRIWRVTAKGRPLVKKPDLAGATLEALLDALKAPEQFTRHHAKRVLKERGRFEVIPILAWLAQLDRNDPAYEHHRLEGLWLYQALDAVQAQLLADILKSPDPRARAAAVRVASQWRDRLPNVMELLAAAMNDEHPRVRIEAVRALALIPSVRSAELAMSALDRPTDQFLDFALWQAARDLEPQWLPAAQRGELDFGGKVKRLTFALQAVASPGVVAPIVQLLKAGKIPAGQEEGLLTLMATFGGPAELRLVYDLAVAEAPHGERGALSAKLLSALTEAALRRKVKPDSDLSATGKLFGISEELTAAATRAVGAWKLEALRPKVEELALAAKAENPATQAALDGLVSLGGEPSRRIFEKLAMKDHPYAVRRMAAIALSALDVKAGAGVAVDLLSETKAGDDPGPLFQSLLQSKDGPAALTAAIGERKLPEDPVKIGVRLARTSGRDLPELVAALSRAAGLSGKEKVLSAEEMQRMVAAVKERGDAARGEAVYRRTDQTCVKCHAISGAGGLVGPDLASIGASAQVDYLIDSLLLPSKQVKENYHSLVVVTTAGKVITGIKLRQTGTELVLRDSEDREMAIPLADVDEQSPGGSIMPVGLTDTLTQADLIDLVRFLSELGKVGPYAPSQARVARRWQALDPATPGIGRLLQTNPSAAAIEPKLAWNPVYSKVNGNLPVADILTVIYPIGRVTASFARTQIEVSTGGKVQLKFNSIAGLQLWLDGKPLDATSLAITLDLVSGAHTILVRINRDERKDDLRLELDDVPGSSAQARFVTGK